ncbi:preprotein translocase subunit Tim44 [Bacillus sp. M6-12]|uniref:hypothetical protein n=1 Tax=Bacillus sp. M6-12 TaxID=2054166 RepID=UPI000C757A90|nr:hypothetical protein [Bacillus sp. M6-12]PLS17723.1 preprotein translocase subunit Tim44 [Bacillus sp. M6-12]
MKKILAAILSAALIFSPVGNFVFQDHSPTAEAKSYKSGKRSFNSNSNYNKSTNNSFFQNKKAANSTKSKSATVNKKGGFRSGSLMKGLMVGGLAGLLFGSLIANMGTLGSIFGFLINILTIFILISVIRSIFSFFRNKKKHEETNQWRR